MINVLKFLGKYWHKIDVYVVIVLMYFFVIVPKNNKIEKQNQMIVANLTEIAKQPKYNITNDFDKIKTTEGSDVNLNLDNNIEDESVTAEAPKEEKKKGILKRLFRKK
jgi:hypothetical protein